MNLSKIIQLRLHKSKFKKINFKENYKVKYFDKNNYESYLSSFISISNLMKKDFEWEGIPNKEDIHRRFENNSHCLFWIYNNEPIGWAWSNKNVTPDWKNSIKKLEVNEIYGGGAYLPKTIKRPPNSGLIFYNLTFEYWLFEMNNDFIYQYSDDWNRVSTIMSLKSGFSKYNFL